MSNLNNYDKRFTEEQVRLLQVIGITSRNTPLEKQRRLYHQLCKIGALIEYLKGENDIEPELRYYAGGVHSVVLIAGYEDLPLQQVDNLIFLRSLFTNKQKYRLYKLTDDDNQNELHITQKISEEYKQFFGVGSDIGFGVQEIITVGTRSLDRLLEKEQLFLLNKQLMWNVKESIKEYVAMQEMIKISVLLFRALLVLRDSGIFHRDLGLGNIVLDQNGHVKVIDFGIATHLPNSEPMDNRKYGGANDLISLGQIIYKAYTGENLFNTSITQSSWYVANRIAKYRKRCYQTPELLETRLLQVDKTIKAKTVTYSTGKFFYLEDLLRDIIKTCLTATVLDPNNTSFAHPDSYDKLKELFKEDGFYIDKEEEKKQWLNNSRTGNLLQIMMIKLVTNNAAYL